MSATPKDHAVSYDVSTGQVRVSCPPGIRHRHSMQWLGQPWPREEQGLRPAPGRKCVRCGVVECNGTWYAPPDYKPVAVRPPCPEDTIQPAKCALCGSAAHATPGPGCKRLPCSRDEFLSNLSKLDGLLLEAGLRPTFDSERSIARPCFTCQAPGPHRLAVIGRYPSGDPRGDLMERPLCDACLSVSGRK